MVSFMRNAALFISLEIRKKPQPQTETVSKPFLSGKVKSLKYPLDLL